jgi:hypothetical protein
MRHYTFTAVRVVQLMNLAAQAISPSNLVSSHVKAELLYLIDKLKNEESMRLLEKESKEPPKSQYANFEQERGG